MRLVRLMAAAAASLVLVSCSAGTDSVASPNFDFAGPPPHPLPDRGDGNTSAELFQICKYGSSGTFDYSVKNNSTNVTTNHTITILDGECWIVAAIGGVGATVTVTETSAQAGFAFDHAEVTTTKGIPAVVQSITNTTNPTVTGVVGGGAIGLPGVTVKYYNVALKQGSIGDFVWNDANANGTQDLGEAGIPGVTVTLSGDASATTTTDANGAYSFSGLGAGNYTVSVGTPAGYSASPTGVGTTATDNNGSPASVTLPSNSSSDQTVDFGFYLTPIPPSGQIGNFVWNDLNQNGVQDVGEPGLAGVIVFLNGAATANTTTNASGLYLFTGLSAGTYTVTVASPSGYSPSPTGAGTLSSDNNGSPATLTLPTNWTSDLTIDFGFYIEPVGGQGCTPGYWKQPQHFDSWAAPYTPNTLFSAVFEDAFPGKTLLQVLGQGGGGLKALGRHTVASLLNGAGSSGVSADYSAASVIAAFNAVYPGTNYEPLHNQFAFANEQGCPLN